MMLNIHAFCNNLLLQKFYVTNFLYEQNLDKFIKNL